MEEDKKRPKVEPRGVLAIWNDLDPQKEIDYNEWYFQEHMLERLGVPGFLSVRRYEAVGGGPRYFSFYLTTSIEVMRSPAYLQRVNSPTEWTRRNMASFRNMNRTACRQTVDLGRGIGCAAVTLEVKAAPGKEDDLRRQISALLFPDLLRSPGATGVIRAQLWEGDPGITVQRSSELALRGGKDNMVDWVVVVEASSPSQAEKAGTLLATSPLTSWGAESVGQPWVYRLMHHLEGPDGH